MQSTEWRPVAGYEGYYEVSERGDVRSVDRTVTTRRGYDLRLRGVPIKGGIDDSGYWRVVLNRDSHPTTLKAHRLVALAFLGAPTDPKHEVCHNDGNPLNNDWRNLRWDTRKANMDDREKHGRTYRGGRLTIPVAVADAIAKRRGTGETVRSIATAFDVSASTVYRLAPDTRRPSGQRYSCRKGHLMAGTNLIVSAAGVRRCRICRRASDTDKFKRPHLNGVEI